MSLRMSTQHVTHLVIGAGVSGLAFANFIESDDYLIVEGDSEIGGYCKTVKKDGFVWDYSGHFFHFKHKELEQYLLDRMPADEVKVVHKDSRIWFGDRWVDFPFQKNIHQLPREDFIDCLYHLYFKDETAGEGPPANFQEMLYAKFGKGIAERFLIPYNEKLYACDLAELDVDAMGRFFPYADLEDIIRNMKEADNASYNATFTYPRGGAIQYVNALKAEVPDARIAFNERVVSIDLKNKVATTTKREISFEHLISSTPFPTLMGMCGLAVPEGALSWNKVLIFNFGFDRKGPVGPHWIYFPEKKYSFYRVGLYDNIFGSDRMSMYVEVGAKADAELDVEATKKQVLADLEAAGIIEGHQLVAEHTITLDPAYVHITKDSAKLVSEMRDVLAARGVYTIGRYGGWTYCSIEDNMLEAQGVARVLNQAHGK